MNDNVKQDQRAGDHCVNIQISNQGPSLSETQQMIKQEVEGKFHAILQDNFIKLREDALACANARSNELMTVFLDKLLQMPQTVTEQVLTRLKEPGIQMSILEAQKGYIKSGDADKLERISSLLKDKLIEKQDSLKSYLIDDALDVIPKLTKTHINFLTCLMYAGTVNDKVCDWDSLKTIVLDDIVGLHRGVEVDNNDLSYLSQLKCVERDSSRRRFNLYKLLENHYKGLFAAGLEEKELDLDLLNKIKPTILMPCINDSKKYQINALNENKLSEKLQKHFLTPKDEQQIKQYFRKILPQYEIQSKIRKLAPTIDSINLWLEQYNNLFLTPLGMLIAISNFKQKFEKNVIWNF